MNENKRRQTESTLWKLFWQRKNEWKDGEEEDEESPIDFKWYNRTK